jgi:LPXTG-motif cell wall-anchored protein
MSRTTVGGVLAAMAVCFTAGTATAQTTTSSAQTKAFEVIAASGNDLVVKLPEGTRGITVPDGFRFTVDGQQLAASDLKPGMKGTAVITTRTTVTPVVVTEVKNGEVVRASGSSLLVRTDQGFKNFTEGDLQKRGIKIVKNGAPAEFSDFHTGDRLTATIVTTHPPKVLTEQQVNATLAKAAPAGGARTATPAMSSGAAPAAAPAASTGAPARKLPKTASEWPLLAVASMLLIATGLMLTVRRRFTL